MKLDLTQELVSFEGEALPTGQEGKKFTLGFALSNILLGAQENVAGWGKCRVYEFAEKCYKSESIDVIEADLIDLKAIVERDKTFNALVGGQVIKMLNKVKE